MSFLKRVITNSNLFQKANLFQKIDSMKLQHISFAYQTLFNVDFAIFTGICSGLYGGVKYITIAPDEIPLTHLKYGFTGALVYGVIGYLWPPIPYIYMLTLGFLIEKDLYLQRRELRKKIDSKNL